SSRVRCSVREQRLACLFSLCHNTSADKRGSRRRVRAFRQLSGQCASLPTRHPLPVTFLGNLSPVSVLRSGPFSKHSRGIEAATIIEKPRLLTGLRGLHNTNTLLGLCVLLCANKFLCATDFGWSRLKVQSFSSFLFVCFQYWFGDHWIRSRSLVFYWLRVA